MHDIKIDAVEIIDTTNAASVSDNLKKSSKDEENKEFLAVFYGLVRLD